MPFEPKARTPCIHRELFERGEWHDDVADERLPPSVSDTWVWVRVWVWVWVWVWVKVKGEG